MADLRRQTPRATRRGKRWDAPIAGPPPPTAPDFIQAESNDSFRGKKSKGRIRSHRFDPPWTVVAAPPTTTWTPQTISRRKQILSLVRRGRFTSLPGTQVAAPGTVSPAFRRKLLATRRGRRWDAFDTSNIWRSLPIRIKVRSSILRRGRRSDVVPTQAAPVAPAYPPQIVRSLRRFLLLRRRVRIEVVPTQAVVTPPSYPPQVIRSSRRFFLLRRRARIEVVPPQVVVISPTYPPQTIRGKRRFQFLRRGKQFFPPWVGAALPSPPTWPPNVVSRRIRSAFLIRRGRRPEASSVAPQPRAVVSRRVVSEPRVRRGKVSVFALVRDRVPDRIKSKQRVAAKRRGRRWDYIVQQIVVVQPSAWVPAVVRSHRVVAALRRGSRFGNLAITRFARVFAEIRTGKFEYGEGGVTDFGSARETESADLGEIEKGSKGDVL